MNILQKFCVQFFITFLQDFNKEFYKDKYWQESGPLINLQRSTLNGEKRHGLLITRVTKTISDNVKKGSWRHDCRCSPYLFQHSWYSKNPRVRTCILPIQPNRFLHEWYNQQPCPQGFSLEEAICNSGERFSDKRQSTPNVSNDFQCHLMICWILLERQFKSCLQIRQINKDKYWQESGFLIILQRSTAVL